MTTSYFCHRDPLLQHTAMKENNISQTLLTFSEEFSTLHVINENFYPRVRPRFFDQVGYQTTNASIGNKYFFTK